MYELTITYSYDAENQRVSSSNEQQVHHFPQCLKKKFA